MVRMTAVMYPFHHRRQDLPAKTIKIFLQEEWAAENSGVFENCYYIGTSVKAGTVGGLAAVNSGSISYCYMQTMVSSAIEDKEGLAAKDTGSIKECFFSVSSIAEKIPGTKKTLAGA